MGGVSGWLIIGLSAVSLGSAAPPVAPSRPVQVAQAYGPVATSPYGQPAYSQPVSSAWETYKTRLAILARQQGVRPQTVQAYVPGLQINQRVIDLVRDDVTVAPLPSWRTGYHDLLWRKLTQFLHLSPPERFTVEFQKRLVLPHARRFAAGEKDRAKAHR